MPVNPSATTAETVATAGVISPTNTTQGNGVSVTINSGTTYIVVGSTIGLGSNATVNNSGTLNTSSFFNGYGISAGANGRSQAGGE
jgi:actin-like ATPase involved in cell morphogenesis